MYVTGSAFRQASRRSRHTMAILVLAAGAAACTDDPMRPPDGVARIDLTPPAASAVRGAQLAFTAVPRNARGDVLLGRVVAWSSSNTAVATVAPGGVVRAVAAGIADITAEAEGKRATARLTVTAPAVTYELLHSGWPDYPLGEWRLYAAALGGGASRLVIPVDALPGLGATQASASPDGSRIAFTAYDPTAGTSHLYVMGADGANLLRLTSGGSEMQPDWSPDGTRLAYVVRPRGQPGDVWVMNADGSGATNVTGGTNALSQYSPAWSPDGTRLAFAEGDAGSSNLWTMRPDGSDRRRLTSGTEWWDDDPSWAPTGDRLVFQRDGPGTLGFDLWTVQATGQGAAPLISLPDGQVVPAWSPDGALIAFNSSHADDPADWFVIYTVRPDGTGLMRRTFDPWMAMRPAWRAVR